MAVKDRRPCPGGTGDAPPPPPAAGPDALIDALPVAGVVEQRPVLRLVPNGGAAMMPAERLVVSRRKLAAVLGPAGEDEDLLRHAADRVAARLPGSVFLPGAFLPGAPPFGCIPARVPVLLPLPLGCVRPRRRGPG